MYFYGSRMEQSTNGYIIPFAKYLEGGVYLIQRRTDLRITLKQILDSYCGYGPKTGCCEYDDEVPNFLHAGTHTYSKTLRKSVEREVDRTGSRCMNINLFSTTLNKRTFSVYQCTFSVMTERLNCCRRSTWNT
jgi:hypothetical protein